MAPFGHWAVDSELGVEMFEFTCSVGDVALIFIRIFSLSINVMIDDVSLEVGLAATEKGEGEWTTT